MIWADLLTKGAAKWLILLQTMVSLFEERVGAAVRVNFDEIVVCLARAGRSNFPLNS